MRFQVEENGALMHVQTDVPIDFGEESRQPVELFLV